MAMGRKTGCYYTSVVEQINNCGDLYHEKQERDHFIRIMNAFKSYRQFSLRRVADAERNYNELPDHQKLFIPNFLRHLDNVQNCIDTNDNLIKLIIQDAEHIFENKHNMATAEDETTKLMLPMVSDMEKVKTTLKQFVRDWSNTGKPERDACYEPVIAEVMKRFPPESCDTTKVNILVPGAGLGRLAFEFARRGYSCQGNEWSLFMLFSSNFVLNKCEGLNMHILHPWVHQWTNNMRSQDQTQPVTFPDIDTSDLPDNVNFSMAAGDFIEVYDEPDTWDSLVTVYFIDTAHNIISYIETIYKVLKPGGYWVNLGPLLYHYSDVPNEMSIELAYEDVKKVIQQVGFVIEMEKQQVKSTYTQNPASLLTYTYDCIMFVARKPA